jgi:hypothetical protein
VLTSRDERMLVAVAMAANRARLARVATAVIDRDDAVTAALRAAGEDPSLFRPLVEVLARHDGRRWGVQLLDLVTEVGQQQLGRRGEWRTFSWPIG